MTPFAFYPPRKFDIDLFMEANPHLIVRVVSKNGKSMIQCHPKPNAG